MRESDLYPPLKRFLEAQGYVVKGEVQDCDVVAVREGEAPVVVELKRTLTLDLVLQAVERLSRTDHVYVGVPRRSAALRRRRKAVLALLRRLGLGLVAIDPAREAGGVDVLLDPGPYRPRPSRARRARLLGEFAKRVGDPNLGGATKRQGIMTAYRQRALAIARLLAARGATKAADIARALDEPRARDIVYRDVYGWFDRVDRGVYGLSPRGCREIDDWIERSEA